MKYNEKAPRRLVVTVGKRQIRMTALSDPSGNGSPSEAGTIVQRWKEAIKARMNSGLHPQVITGGTRFSNDI